MNVGYFSVFISETIGSVRAVLTTPRQMRAIMTLAHGAGAGMDHPFMRSLADALAALGIGTMGFNFPYLEKGKRIPDPPAIAEHTIGKILEKAHELFPATPLWAAGKSFGGRMTSQYLSKHAADFVKGIIFYGFPLHPPGKPSTIRAEHLLNVRYPMLFLQGTNDALAQFSLMESVVSGLSAATLVSFHDADHSFKSGKKILVAELAEKTGTWIGSFGVLP